MANDIFPGATLVQLVEWGYPMGSLRPTPPANLAFSVIHVTANVASAQNEAAWRLNDPGLQNSATFFVNRDGSVVQCLGDPLHMDPWTNGDVANPDTSNLRIAALGGVNPNERSLVTIENIGREPEAPITPAQEATCARIIAYYHAKAGVPINRQTVIGHYQINSVNRANCPSTNKSVIDRIVALAAGQGDDMDASFEPIYNRAATLIPGTTHVDKPAGGQVVWTVPSVLALPIVGRLKGPVINGTDQWLVYWQGDVNRWQYFHEAAGSTGLVALEAGGGFTQEDLNRAAMDAKVPAAKAGATAAAKAAADFAASLP